MTPRQARAYEAAVRLHRRTRRPVNYRALAREMGLSNSTVFVACQDLIESGRLVRVPGRQSTLLPCVDTHGDLVLAWREKR